MKPQFEIIPYEHAIVHWSDHLERYYTYQSLTQCAAEILTSILNTPYEDATFHTRWSESLEILMH